MERSNQSREEKTVRTNWHTNIISIASKKSCTLVGLLSGSTECNPAEFDIQEKQWVNSFISIYQCEDVTPYTHCLAMHVSQFVTTWAHRCHLYCWRIVQDPAHNQFHHDYLTSFHLGNPELLIRYERECRGRIINENTILRNPLTQCKMTPVRNESPNNIELINWTVGCCKLRWWKRRGDLHWQFWC